MKIGSCGAYFKEIEVLLDKILMLKLESGSYYNQVMLCDLPISTSQLPHHVSYLEVLIIMVISWHLQKIGGFLKFGDLSVMTKSCVNNYYIGNIKWSIFISEGIYFIYACFP